MSLFRPEPTRHGHINRSTSYIGDPLAVLFNEVSWKLSMVSPLYNLTYTTVKLKQYASKIKQAVVRTVAANSSIQYVVKIEEQANLKYSEDDANSLIINVSTSLRENSSKSNVVYSAILLSWGVSSSLENAIHLPYMLERGEQRLGVAVKSELQKLFDCNIKQYSFTQTQLLQFGFSFVENDSSKGTDPFKLSYRSPKSNFKEKLTLSFEVEEVQIIWNRLRGALVNKSDLPILAYQLLQNQIFDMIMLDITAFNLCEISLPRAEVKSNGIVKMKTPEMVNCVLTVLNEITDIVHSEIDLSNSADSSMNDS